MKSIGVNSKTKISLTRQFKNQQKEIQKELQECSLQSTWAALQFLKEMGEVRLQEIIRDNFYKTRGEPVAYERTYQFLNCGIIKITQGHGTYNMQVILDTTRLHSKPPAQPSFFPSYAYKFDGRKIKGEKQIKAGTPLTPEQKLALVRDWNNDYEILDTFNEWVHKTYPELFDKQFQINLRKVNVKRKL